MVSYPHAGFINTGSARNDGGAPRLDPASLDCTSHGVADATDGTILALNQTCASR
jgi:hypothetical protein